MVGSSFGGVTALELAARGRAARVVALAPPWVAGRGAVFYGALFSGSLPGIRLTEPLPEILKRPMLGLTLQGSLRSLDLSGRDAAALWRSWGRFPFFRSGAQLALRGQLGPGMPDFDRIDVPVTLVWGGDDRIVPGWMRDRWERALPGADVRTLPGFAHCPHLRDPELVARLILD
jgi:pimeloyl-ACP methyl ester carboxylesterase